MSNGEIYEKITDYRCLNCGYEYSVFTKEKKGIVGNTCPKCSFQQTGLISRSTGFDWKFLPAMTLVTGVLFYILLKIGIHIWVITISWVVLVIVSAIIVIISINSETEAAFQNAGDVRQPSINRMNAMAKKKIAVYFLLILAVASSVSLIYFRLMMPVEKSFEKELKGIYPPVVGPGDQFVISEELVRKRNPGFKWDLYGNLNVVLNMDNGEKYPVDRPFYKEPDRKKYKISSGLPWEEEEVLFFGIPEKCSFDRDGVLEFYRYEESSDEDSKEKKIKAGEMNIHLFKHHIGEKYVLYEHIFFRLYVFSLICSFLMGVVFVWGR